MNAITEVSRANDGSIIISYTLQGSYRWMNYYYYTKREALKLMRQKLGIKRNPCTIRDNTRR